MSNQMQSIGRILLQATLLLPCTTAGARQQAVAPRHGDMVVLKSLDVELESEGQRIRTDDWFRMYRIQDFDGDRLLVFGDHFYPTGWVKSTDVVADKNAADYFSGRIQRQPQSSHDYFLRGAIRLRFGRVELAREDLVRAISLDPRLTPARIELAKIKSQGPDFSGARADLNEAIRLAPNSAPAHLCRSELLRFEGSFDLAITDLTEAIRLQPTNGFFFCKRAYVWKLLSNDDNALDDYGTGLRLTPKTAWAHLARGIILEEKGKTELAIADFDEAIQLNAGLGEGYIHRAHARMLLANVDGALQDATYSVWLSPTSWAAHTARGIVLERMGKFDRAVVDFDKAVTLDPKSWDPLFWRGYHWERQSKLELCSPTTQRPCDWSQKNQRHIAHGGGFGGRREISPGPSPTLTKRSASYPSSQMLTCFDHSCGLRPKSTTAH